MIGSANSHSSEDELKHLHLSFWEDGEDVLKRDLLQLFVKPFTSWDPHARVANESKPAETPVRVKGVAVVKSLVDVDVLLNALHCEQALGKVCEISLARLRAKERSPKVSYLGLSRFKRALDPLKVLECRDVLQRLKASGIVDTCDLLGSARPEDTMLDVVSGLTQFYMKVERAQVLYTFVVELR